MVAIHAHNHGLAGGKSITVSPPLWNNPNNKGGIGVAKYSLWMPLQLHRAPLCLKVRWSRCANESRCDVERITEAVWLGAFEIIAVTGFKHESLKTYG